LAPSGIPVGARRQLVKARHPSYFIVAFVSFCSEIHADSSVSAQVDEHLVRVPGNINRWMPSFNVIS
jgi:hypothetical protein